MAKTPSKTQATVSCGTIGSGTIGSGGNPIGSMRYGMRQAQAGADYCGGGDPWLLCWGLRAGVQRARVLALGDFIFHAEPRATARVVGVLALSAAYVMRPELAIALALGVQASPSALELRVAGSDRGVSLGRLAGLVSLGVWWRFFEVAAD